MKWVDVWLWRNISCIPGVCDALQNQSPRPSLGKFVSSVPAVAMESQPRRKQYNSVCVCVCVCVNYDG